MTIMPVYAGDEVEVPVVNENFTNWTQKGLVVESDNNRLDYSNNPPNATVWTGNVKVPLRFGFTSGGKDSVTLSLDKCNIIPQYGPRIYNIPGADMYTGYVAFMGPNDSKGYLKVDSLLGIIKIEADVSSYDLPGPDRACGFKVNGDFVRNKMLQKLYPENVEISNDPLTKISLQVGPGNQARVEYLVPASSSASIDTGSSQVSAAAVALHNLKMYAKVSMPDMNYYKLTLPAVSGGKISGVYPAADNSTNSYLQGTKVTLTALPASGFGFDGWVDGSNNSIGMDNPLTITMNADKTAKPVFDQKASFIKLIANNNGTVTTSIEPQEMRNDTMRFLAGIAVSLTATPKYGYTFTKWVKNGVDVTTNPLVLGVTDMGKNVTNVVSVVFDSITSRATLSIANDSARGEITFDHSPENVTYLNDTLKGKFPAGETIEVSVTSKYGYDFSAWKPGLDIPDADTANNPVSLTMDGNKKIGAIYSPVARDFLMLMTAMNGSISISDIHKDGTLEQQGLWPQDYYVEITVTPADGYMFSDLLSGASYINEGQNIIKVKMDQDTVRVTPVFTVFKPIIQISENFQDPALWPEPEGTVSNVVGAREFLSLPSDWDPTTYNDDLEGLLEVLSEYRVWGSQSNDNSDGPNGTKIPHTTLSLRYQDSPMINKVRVGSGTDSINITVVKYAPCNNCLIGKAVKEGYISYHYLGHVTPGMVALRKPNVEIRSIDDYPAFMAGDSLGMMLIEGLVYVDKLEVGYVSAGTQFCPGVFYTTDPIQIIGNDGLFAASFSDLWPLGQLSGKEISLTPYNNAYGWGSSQEGMIMDQGMSIAEEGVAETKILITAGYKDGATDYLYSDIYVHDVRIWGSPRQITNVRDLFINNSTNSKFYMLGSTNMLKLDLDEPAKALVVYNMNGAAVKVVREVYDNLVNLSDLQPGVYAVHCYGISGKVYTGSFGKPNE